MGLFSFAVNPDKESEGNSPQRVCNDGKQFDTPKNRSGQWCIIAECCHECNKKYGEPDCNEYCDCPYTPFPVLFDVVQEVQDASLPIVIFIT
jgi:hypothetical protein